MADYQIPVRRLLDLVDVQVQSTDPTTRENGDALQVDDLWRDTSTSPQTWNVWEGAAWQPMGAGGVSDHGALTGLGDDDHPQYLLGTDGGKGTVNVVASSGSSLELDLADGNDHDVTLDDDCTLMLAGATAGMSCYMTVLLRQDATGGRTPTWPSSVEWVGGSAPTLQSDAEAWDTVVLFTYDGGTRWFAHHSGTASGGGGSSDRVWMPLTTVVSGEPELVWDEDNSLIPTEVPI